MAEKQRRSVAVIGTPEHDAAIVKSAARVLQVFELFNDLQRPARAGEIASRLGYPQSSTSVLLKTLVQLGYLEIDDRERAFQPSPRVALLGAWRASRSGSLAPILAAMQELSDETGMTITLAARTGLYAQYIHVLQATSTLRLDTPIGTNRLLVWSAAGFALIGDLEDSGIRLLVHRTQSEFPGTTRKITAAAVLEHVRSFREKGYFLSNELVTPGGGHISLRVPETAQTRPLAIGVSGWIEDILREESRFVRVMRRALARLKRG
jgi:DNA-binding IclR family transcriptional regulator